MKHFRDRLRAMEQAAILDWAERCPWPTATVPVDLDLPTLTGLRDLAAKLNTTPAAVARLLLRQGVAQYAVAAKGSDQ